MNILKNIFKVVLYVFLICWCLVIVCGGAYYFAYYVLPSLHGGCLC